MFTKRFIFLAVVLLMLYSVGNAQMTSILGGDANSVSEKTGLNETRENYTISGKVTRGSKISDGLAGVVVSLIGYEGLSATTDANGNYSISNVPTAEFGAVYNVGASLAGYKLWRGMINVYGAETSLTLNITLPSGVVAEKKSATAVEITWKPAGDIIQYVYDNGTAEGFNQTNPTYSSWRGNVYNVGESGIITSVDVYGHSTSPGGYVKLGIFDEDQQLLSLSDQFQLLGGWNNIPFPDIEFDGTFYVMLLWDIPQGGLQAYLGNDTDSPYRDARLRWAITVNDWTAPWVNGIAGAPGSSYIGVFMMRPNVVFPAEKEVGRYEIYSLIKGAPETEWTKLKDDLTVLSYTDEGYGALAEQQIYQYAVKTVYTDNTVSAPSFSNDLMKGLEFDFLLEIDTETEEPVIGAVVSMVNKDGDPDHVYNLVSGEEGVLIPLAWIGEYDLTINLPRFNTYTDVVTVSSTNLSYSATLIKMTNVQISGKVTGNDAPGGLKDVLINLKSDLENISISTDANGDFVIPSLIMDTYDVKATLSGYQDWTGTFEVTFENLTFDIMLSEILYPAKNIVAEKVGDDIKITWTEPSSDGLSYIYDDDDYDTGWGINAAYDMCIGAMFPVAEKGVLTSIDLYSVYNVNGSSIRLLTAEVYNAERELVGVSEPFTFNQNPSQWVNVKLPEIPYSGTFYVMVRWPISTVTTNWLGMDDNGPYANSNLDFIIDNNGVWQYLHVAWSASGAEPCVVMIRANATYLGETEPVKTTYSYTDNYKISEDVIYSSQAPKNDDTNAQKYNAPVSPKGNSKEFLYYSVERLELGQAASEWELLDTNITETTYLDETYNELEFGRYQWAVRAWYSSDEPSGARLSNIIDKDMYVTYVVNITTSNGVSSAGAVVKLTNKDGDRNHIYVTVADGTGKATFTDEVWRGIYDIQISLTGFYRYYDYDLDITAAGSHSANLIEGIFIPFNVVAEKDENETKVDITWEAPIGDKMTVIYDDGTAEGYSQTNPGFESWFGNIFEVGEKGILTSIDVFGAATSTGAAVTVDIFNEKRELVGTSAPFLLVPGWTNVQVPNVEYENTFYAMVHWKLPTGETKRAFLGNDTNGPRSSDRLRYILQGATGAWSQSIPGAPGTQYVGVFMVRANALVTGMIVNYGIGEKEEIETPRAVANYDFYRLVKGAPETEWTPLADHLTNLSYKDENFGSLPDLQIYQYAVKTRYTTGDVSEATLSNEVPKGFEFDFQIDVATNSYDPATGARITLTNQNGLPAYIYKAVSGPNGVLIPKVWLGSYNVRIEMDGFEVFTGTTTITGEYESYNATLTEILYPLSFVKTNIVENNANVRWGYTSHYRYDCGTVASNLGYGINYPNGVLGSAHRVNAELLTMSWYVYSGTASVYIFELDDNGLPTNKVLFESRNVTSNYSGWTEINLPEPIFTPKGFFLALGPSSSEAGYVGLAAPTDEYPYLNDTHYWSNDFASQGFFTLESNYSSLNIMIRASGYENGKSTSFGYGGDRSFLGYSVYRLIEGQTNIDDWTLLVNNISERTYTDMSWNSLAMNKKYQYGIKANYSSGSANVLLSSPLLKETPAELTVTVKSNNDNYGTVEGGNKYQEGSSATIKATAKDGYKFVNWTEDGGGVFATTATHTFTVAKSITLVANFVSVDKFLVTIEVNPAGAGTFTGAGEYNVNAEVTVTATPVGNYTFIDWKKDGVTVSTNPTYKFTITDNVVLVANFTNVGINNSETVQFTIYPNPVSDELRIVRSATGKGRIDIYNISGVLINTFETLKDELSVDVSKYTSGQYIIRLTDSKTSETKMFIKK